MPLERTNWFTQGWGGNRLRRWNEPCDWFCILRDQNLFAGFHLLHEIRQSIRELRDIRSDPHLQNVAEHICEVEILPGAKFPVNGRVFIPQSFSE